MNRFDSDFLVCSDILVFLAEHSLLSLAFSFSLSPKCEESLYINVYIKGSKVCSFALKQCRHFGRKTGGTHF